MSRAGRALDCTPMQRDGSLLHTRQLHTISVADRMAWAAGRETTRVEDEAYCLMGVFGVRLPVIYGEGSQAFIRLQEEIMRRIPDQSLFLWGVESNIHCIPPPAEEPWPELTSVPMDNLRASKSAYLFALSPMDFSLSKGFSPIPLGTFSSILGLPEAFRPPLYTPSSYGVRTTFPIGTLLCPSMGANSNVIEIHVAILACQDVSGRIPTLLLSTEVSSGQHFTGGFRLHTSFRPSTLAKLPRSLPVPRTKVAAQLFSTPYSMASVERGVGVRYASSYTRIALLDPAALKKVASLALQDVCIPHQRLSAVSSLTILRNLPNPAPVHRYQGFCDITLPCWTLEHLSALGFSTNVTIKNGEMVPIALRVARGLHRTVGVRGSCLDAGACHHDLTLNHRTRGTIIVMVSICSATVSGSRRPLHATVAWVSGRNSQAHDWGTTQVGSQLAVQKA